jgi:hypothetical protein
MSTTHDRDRFADLIPAGRGPLSRLSEQRLWETAVEGLEAAATLWFGEYTDETDLPPQLWGLYRLLVDDLGSPVESQRIDPRDDEIAGDEAF